MVCLRPAFSWPGTSRQVGPSKSRPVPIPAEGSLLSLHVGRPRQFEFNGSTVASAIWKMPVAGRLAVAGINIAGDEQADREAHGGPDKAI